MIPGIRAPTMIWWNIGEESTNTATMPIHTTDTRIVTPKDGMVAVWGEGILGGKLLLLRTTHPKVVLWNKQASAEKTKRGQWIQSRPLKIRALKIVEMITTNAWKWSWKQVGREPRQ